MQFGLACPPTFFCNYKDVLERALKVEADLKRFKQPRGKRKRLKSIGARIDQQEDSENNSKRKKDIKICGYHGKNHDEPCLKKLRVCDQCCKVGHLAQDCPKKKKDTDASS